MDIKGLNIVYNRDSHYKYLKEKCFKMKRKHNFNGNYVNCKKLNWSRENDNESWRRIWKGGTWYGCETKYLCIRENEKHPNLNNNVTKGNLWELMTPLKRH